jgi:hypothetical protein
MTDRRASVNDPSLPHAQFIPSKLRLLAPLGAALALGPAANCIDEGVECVRCTDNRSKVALALRGW